MHWLKKEGAVTSVSQSSRPQLEEQQKVVRVPVRKGEPGGFFKMLMASRLGTLSGALLRPWPEYIELGARSKANPNQDVGKGLLGVSSWLDSDRLPKA